MTRPVDRDLLIHFMIEVFDYPEDVARETMMKLELDGDGLILNEAWQECKRWNTQMQREIYGNE